jgi:aspartate-semialdehyde dehydrogenase
MKLSSAKIVVTGATSVMGRDILGILSEQGVPKQNVSAVDATRGDEISYGENDILKVQSFESFDFKGVQIVLHAGEERETASWAKRAVSANAVFIDGSGVFALDPDVPLIVPEVNGAVFDEKLKKNIIACPNSLGIFLSLALKPLHKNAGVMRVVVSTYQAVSHWGREAQDELFSQTKAVFMAQGDIKNEYLPKQIAFNCYPMMGHEREDGLTDVESRTIAHVKKILDPKIKVAVNTVTVPCFVGDGMMVNVECRDEVTPIKAALWMTGQKGLGVIEGDDIATHADIAAEDLTFVARMREDVSVENGLAFWMIGDNLRKGSALNMVQIAESYLKNK